MKNPWPTRSALHGGSAGNMGLYRAALRAPPRGAQPALRAQPARLPWGGAKRPVSARSAVRRAASRRRARAIARRRRVGSPRRGTRVNGGGAKPIIGGGTACQAGNGTRIPRTSECPRDDLRRSARSQCGHLKLSTLRHRASLVAPVQRCAVPENYSSYAFLVVIITDT